MQRKGLIYTILIFNIRARWRPYLLFTRIDVFNH